MQFRIWIFSCEFTFLVSARAVETNLVFLETSFWRLPWTDHGDDDSVWGFQIFANVLLKMPENLKMECPQHLNQVQFGFIKGILRKPSIFNGKSNVKCYTVFLSNEGKPETSCSVRQYLKVVELSFQLWKNWLLKLNIFKKFWQMSKKDDRPVYLGYVWSSKTS